MRVEIRSRRVAYGVHIGINSYEKTQIEKEILIVLWFMEKWKLHHLSLFDIISQKIEFDWTNELDNFVEMNI